MKRSLLPTKLTALLLASLLASVCSPCPPAHAQQTVLLPEGTALKLQMVERLDNRYSLVGHPAKLEVAEDVLIEERVAVRAGTPVEGVVTVSKKAKLGKGGQLDFTIQYVDAVDGSKVRVRPLATAREGDGQTNTLTTGLVIAALSSNRSGTSFGLALALTSKGKNVSIEQGTTFTVYVDRDREINCQ